MTLPQKYIPHLDGLRGWSILIVSVSHGALGHIIPGGFGVTVFFFISGYLITSLLMKEKEETQRISLTRFYMRRLWRLFPAMLVYALLSVVVLLYFNHGIKWIEPVTAVFYLSNYYKLFVGYTAINSMFSPFDIVWSLAVEEHFYVFFAPLVAWLASRRAAFLSVIAMLVLPLAIRLGVYLLSSSDYFASEYTYRSTECRIDSIAWGCLLALIDWKQLSRRKDLWILLIGAALIVSSFLMREEAYRQVLRYSIQGLGLFLAIGAITCADGLGFIRAQLSQAWIVFIGKISYSMYLYHWLALILAEAFFVKTELTLTSQAIYWGLTLTMSVASYYGVERPCLSLRRKYGSNV